MMYNFVIKLLVLLTLSVRVSVTLNVGTTLFNTADHAKKEWYKREVSLLTARKYFQDLIPSIKATQHPKYVSFLNRYIRDCYAAVNREQYNRETESILTDALSDVLGGYLKMIALPVTKSIYYSVGLPDHEALQLFQYYENIKNHLQSRGTGWADQVTDIIKLDGVRGARSDHSLLTHTRNPCQRLLYLQNPQNNLSMPMPSIEWKTRTMFVPLKEQPIVDLRSPDANSILQEFHQIAVACEQSMKSEKPIFENSFGNWVNMAVVPHLSDDDLYTAFKSIMQLIQKSSSTSPTAKPLPREMNFFSNTCHMSTNMVIILSIMLIEVICCIPTLVYVLRKSKKKSKKQRLINTYTCPTTCTCNFDSSLCCNKAIYEFSSESTPSHSQDKITSLVDLTTKCLSPTELSTFSGRQRSTSSLTTEVHTVVEEILAPKIKSKRENGTQPSRIKLNNHQTTETDRIDVAEAQAQISRKALFSSATLTGAAVSFISTSRNAVRNDTSETGISPTRDKAVKNRIRKRIRKRTGSSAKVNSPGPFTSSQVMLPTPTVEFNEKFSKPAENLKLEMFDDQLWDKALLRFETEKKVEFAVPQVTLGKRSSTKIRELSSTHVQVPKTRHGGSIKESAYKIEVSDRIPLQQDDYKWKISKSRSRLQTNVQLDLEETPRNRSDSDRTAVSKGILKSEEEKYIKRKNSKIPKRITACNVPTDIIITRSRWTPMNTTSSAMRSLIPTAERTRDDNSVPSSTRKSKLNNTL